MRRYALLWLTLVMMSLVMLRKSSAGALNTVTTPAITSSSFQNSNQEVPDLAKLWFDEGSDVILALDNSLIKRHIRSSPASDILKTLALFPRLASRWRAEFEGRDKKGQHIMDPRMLRIGSHRELFVDYLLIDHLKTPACGCTNPFPVAWPFGSTDPGKARRTDRMRYLSMTDVISCTTAP